MRLIDADELKKDAVEMETFLPYGGDGTVMAVDVDCIDVAPTIDAELVRHGEWIDNPTNLRFYCSICGIHQTVFTGKTNYCSHCGAKMDKGAKV